MKELPHHHQVRHLTWRDIGIHHFHVNLSSRRGDTATHPTCPESNLPFLGIFRTRSDGFYRTTKSPSILSTASACPDRSFLRSVCRCGTFLLTSTWSWKSHHFYRGCTADGWHKWHQVSHQLELELLMMPSNWERESEVRLRGWGGDDMSQHEDIGHSLTLKIFGSDLHQIWTSWVFESSWIWQQNHGGVSWAMLGCSGTLKNLRPCMPCSRNVWPVKSCSWRHLVLLTLSWSIMTCQPSTNRDVFLFASSCYPLAKPSGETLKLLAVSVPSTKEQNSQETNSSFPADDSPSALGPFFRFDFDDPLRRKRDGDDGPVAPNVWKTLGWNMMKHVETYTSPGFFWVHQWSVDYPKRTQFLGWIWLE